MNINIKTKGVKMVKIKEGYNTARILFSDKNNYYQIDWGNIDLLNHDTPSILTNKYNLCDICEGELNKRKYTNEYLLHTFKNKRYMTPEEIKAPIANMYNYDTLSGKNVAVRTNLSRVCEKCYKKHFYRRRENTIHKKIEALSL